MRKGSIVASRNLVLCPSNCGATSHTYSHKSRRRVFHLLFHSQLTPPACSSLMSFIEEPLQTAYPDEFSDAVAKMTASILREQLAPILDTLREHARLLDLHAALLNHSTAMNRYNVGKLDDIRDFQNNIK